VLDIDARLGLDPAGRLQAAARGVLVAARRGVADVDLARRKALQKDPGLSQLRARKPVLVPAVALANKIAGTV
jgi:hypothetical protein